MSLSVWQRNIVTEAGDVIPDAEIEVFDAGSSSKPDLFSDPDGDSSLTNPFNADTNGFARFYVSGGRYDVSVNGTVLWEDVALGTTQGRDTGTGANEVPTNSDLGTASLADTGTAADEVPTNEDLLNSSSTGTQSDHEDPEDKSLLARLDHIEAALGIDTNGPAGANVLAAVGRGAIVESGSNSNGHYVRWENGEQVCWAVVFMSGYISTNSIGQEWTYPASFDGRAHIRGTVLDFRNSILEDNATAGGNNFKTTSFGCRNNGTSNASLRAYSDGQFSDGDIVGVNVEAWGFWK